MLLSRRIMFLTVTTNTYIEGLMGHSNEPITLSKLLEPFALNLNIQDFKSDFYLIGHFIDFLKLNSKMDDVLDPIDIASYAWNLGCDEVETFLDEGPSLIASKVCFEKITSNF